MNKLTKIAIVCVGIFVVIGGLLAYLVLWTGSTHDIEMVADKLNPGSEWTLISERVEPPRHVCLGGGTCPELSRTWKSSKTLNKNDLVRIIPKSYNIQLSKNCLNSEQSDRQSCYGSGELNGFSVDISYDADGQSGGSSLTLNVRKDN